MTASNGARFQIVGSVSGLHPSTAKGAVVIPGETLTISLEELGSHIRNAKFEITADSAAAAPALVFNPVDGVPIPLATSGVTMVVPLTGPWSYEIRSTANRGYDGNGNLVYDWSFDRVISIQPNGLRHMILSEGGDFDPTYGYAQAVNQLVNKVETGLVINNANLFYVDDPVYGAKGDGVTDDTVAIQAAITAAGLVSGRVFLGRGKTYIVTDQGTKTINAVVHHYCLDIPSNVMLDLNGGTLKLGVAENATILINRAAGGAGNTNVVIIGPGTFDGNQTNQTVPASGEMPCIRLDGVSGAFVDNIEIINARDYFARFMACSDSSFDNLVGETSYGDGWSFCIAANSKQLVDSNVGSVKAVDCSGDYGALEGNGIIITAHRCSFGDLCADNCAGGTKIQDASQDVSIGSSTFVGGANSSNNSGTKLQGQNGLELVRVLIGNVISKDCDAEGLVFNYCFDCSVDQYVGQGNAAGGAVLRDVNFERAVRCSINVLSSRNSGGQALLFNAFADMCSVGVVNVYNPTGVAVQASSSISTRIGELRHVDDRGVGALTTAVLYISGSDNGSCGLLQTNMASSTTQPRLGVASGNYKYYVERVSLNDGADPIFGVVTLSAGTTTAVANASVWSHDVGGGDHQHPVIEVMPWDSASAALGLMRAVAIDFATGTGFTIEHAIAVGNEKVAYRIFGSTLVATPEA